MHLDDNYTFDGDATEGSVFAGEAHSLPAFKRMLHLAERRKGLLPPWWSADKAKECIELGMKEIKRGENWSSLFAGPDESDIIEHYRDAHMPMQLSMFGEQVYGRGPGGQSGLLCGR